MTIIVFWFSLHESLTLESLKKILKISGQLFLPDSTTVKSQTQIFDQNKPIIFYELGHSSIIYYVKGRNFRKNLISRMAESVHFAGI